MTATTTINYAALQSLDAALKFARWQMDAAMDNLDAAYDSLFTQLNRGLLTDKEFGTIYAVADLRYQADRNEAMRRFLRLENLVIASNPATVRHWRSIKGNFLG